MSTPTTTTTTSIPTTGASIPVQVIDPITEGEGRHAFTTYLVSTDKHGVRRRYSDFQWLTQRLHTELPGAVVPIIPHKRTMISTANKLDPALIQERLGHLQRFMNQVISHPELSRAPSMTPFMLDQVGVDFDAGKKKVEASNPSSPRMDITDTPEAGGAKSHADSTTAMAGAAKKGLTKFLAKAKTSLQVKTGSAALMQTSNEKEVETIRVYISEVEGHVSHILKATEALVSLTGKQVEWIHEIGVPVGAWKTTYQSQKGATNTVADPSVLNLMSAFCNFSNDYSTLVHYKHLAEQREFELVVQGLSLTIRAMQQALKVRKQWQLSYTSRYQQIIDQEAALAKAHKSMKPPEVTDKLQADKVKLETQANIVKAKLEDCTARFLREAARIQPQLEQKLKEAIRGYAKVQREYTARSDQAFGQLMNFVEETDENEQGGDDSTATWTPAATPTPSETNETAPTETTHETKEDAETKDEPKVEQV